MGGRDTPLGLFLCVLGCASAVPPAWHPSRPPPCQRTYGLAAASGVGSVGLFVLAVKMHCGDEETENGDYDPFCSFANAGSFFAGLGAVTLAVVSGALLLQSLECGNAQAEHREWLAKPPGQRGGPCRPTPPACDGRLVCVDGVVCDRPPAPLPPPPPPPSACEDGADNDGDRLVDRGDPGCHDGEDTTETCAGADCPGCDNGLDDDGDGAVDLVDLECKGPRHPSESCGWTFKPQRVDACAAGLRVGEAIALGQTGKPYAFDTDTGVLSYGALELPTATTLGPEGRVWALRSLRLGPQVLVQVSGKQPLVVLIDGTAEIAGTLDSGVDLQLSARTRLSVSGRVKVAGEARLEAETLDLGERAEVTGISTLRLRARSRRTSPGAVLSPLPIQSELDRP